MKDSLRQQLLPLRPGMKPLAGLCVVLALWFGWTGVAQFLYESRVADLGAVRDSAVQLTHQALKQQQERLTKGLGEDDAQSALAAGDLATAQRVIGAGWPNLVKLQVLPPDLDGVYDELPRGGYGRLAAIESALSENRIRTWITTGPGKPQLTVAAPAKTGGRLVGAVYAELPLTELTAGLDTLASIDDGYLALRQGSVSLWERGEQAYADGAERMAVQVGDTGLRVVAGTASPPGQALDLGPVLSLIFAGGCLALAVLAWRLSSLREVISEPGEVQTLEDAVASAPGPSSEGAPALDIREAPKAAPVVIDRSIFRAYDIRGVVGRDLDRNVAELIGQSIGTVMQGQNLREIVVGRDGRLSGPDLVEGLTNGLRKAGIDVVDIGMVPTPVTYFGAYHLRTGCCVSLTGSHNPPDYNGFKIVVGGETLSGDAIVDLHTRIVERRLHVADVPGRHSERDISADYVMRIASDVQLGRPLRVVVDAGNGVAGEIGPRVLEAIGAEVEELYCEIDGTFPNHHPDPSEPHNLVDLISMVQRRGADLGIAFDGDGDRLGVVTRDGENIFADRLLMLFAADVLERNPGAMIVYDVKCTGRLASHILRHGGSPLMWKTGHSLIKAKMRETGAELAGEMSGHFFFAERWYGFDDGIYSAARLLEILATAAEEPDVVLRALPKGVSTPEIKVDAPDGDPHAFVERFRDGAFFEGGRLSTIDGLRVDWPDGWGLVRASNTTPVLVLRFDADSEQALARIKEVFRARLLELAPTLSLPF
jgi:phosphomannomutase / phosphoglucomutase